MLSSSLIVFSIHLQYNNFLPYQIFNRFRNSVVLQVYLYFKIERCYESTQCFSSLRSKFIFLSIEQFKETNIWWKFTTKITKSIKNFICSRKWLHYQFITLYNSLKILYQNAFYQRWLRSIKLMGLMHQFHLTINNDFPKSYGEHLILQNGSKLKQI